MTKVQYTKVGTGDETFISVFVPGSTPLVAHSSHPQFDAIVEGAENGDPNVVDLFDIAQTVERKFQRLSDRITVENGTVYLDHEPINDAIAGHILSALDQGVDDFTPLVKFYEKLMSNPNEHSREFLYEWLTALLEDGGITIDQDGDIVGYKGVSPDGNGGWQSGFAGRAIVNGVKHDGYIPNPIGAVVEMPRNEVHHDPSSACSSGLHVGTYSYATQYAHGAMLEVRVNPRDVVSVPTDAHGQKVRCCRYVVVDVINAPHTAAVVYDDDVLPLDEGDDYEWGDGEPESDIEGVDPTPVAAPTTQALYDDGKGFTLRKGDVFRDRDSRRGNRTFTVEKVELPFAVGKSNGLAGLITRTVNIDRLNSYRYERV